MDVPGLSGRRRATLAVLGGAAAVVLVLGAVWLASGDGERDAAPGPAGASPTPTEAPTVSPSAPDPAGGTIPDDFPLDLDQEAMEGDGGEMLGPSAEAPGLRDLTLCGTSIWTVEPLERLASTATGPEYADSRELRVYPTADDAARQVADLRALLAGCPEEQVHGGGVLVHAPIDADTGYDSVTWGDTYTEGLGGGPVQVVRVGRAVLAVARGGEFAPETLPAGVAEVTDRTAAIAPAMCAFTETGCGVSGSHGAGSGEWTIGPEGIGPFVLGMKRADVEAAGARFGDGGVEKRCVPFNWRPDSHTTISGLVELGIGIVRLSAAGESRTADGVGIGSTYDDLERTYPDGEGDGIGFRADMPHTDRYYRFEANRDGVVSSVMLAFHGTSCAG